MEYVGTSNVGIFLLSLYYHCMSEKKEEHVGLVLEFGSKNRLRGKAKSWSSHWKDGTASNSPPDLLSSFKKEKKERFLSIFALVFMLFIFFLCSFFLTTTCSGILPSFYSLLTLQSFNSSVFS